MMIVKEKLLTTGLQRKLFIALVLFYSAYAHGQVIQNPLVRPANMVQQSESNGAASAPGRPAVNQQPSVPNAQNNEDQLRQKAENRITQEEFNLRQQELNAATVPLPLSTMFNQMFVSAYVDRTVVLRKANADFDQSPASVVAQAGNQTNSSGSGATRSQGAVLATQVLRLKVGQKTNLNGYTIRAQQEGQEVTVEWLNPQGKWIAVYFGALESGSQVSILPAKENLEKFDSSTFDYLRPQVSSRVTSGGTTPAGGAAPQSGFGSAQPAPQPGATAF